MLHLNYSPLTKHWSQAPLESEWKISWFCVDFLCCPIYLKCTYWSIKQWLNLVYPSPPLQPGVVGKMGVWRVFTPPKTNMEGPKMMGLGKGNSLYFHGNFGYRHVSFRGCSLLNPGNYQWHIPPYRRHLLRVDIHNIPVIGWWDMKNWIPGGFCV